MRFLTKRRLLIIIAIPAVAVLALVGAFFIYIHSSAFEQQARELIIREIERRTGGRASLEDFDWAFWDQHFRLEGLTLHGLEPASEPPLAHFPRIDIGIHFRTLLQRRIDLFELIITRPEFHVLIYKDGRTNIPSPPQAGPRRPFNFAVNIDNFKILDGATFFNERRVNIDFGLANLAADLKFNNVTEILSTHLRYDGKLDRRDKPTIPYTLDADLDYARNTLLVQRMDMQSGGSLIKLQGRVNQLLTRNIAGKLDYTGKVEIPFLNYLFTKEKFAGMADVAGFLEFSRGYFFTRGATAADVVDFEGWHATQFRSDYTYHYPERRASFRNLRAQIVGGTTRGNVVVENLPGPSRVNVDIDYMQVDAAALARAYPWDPKYRIFSRMTGTLNGWFEGKLKRFIFSGTADMKAYTPEDATGLVALPLDGTTGYEVRPGQARVSGADVRFYSTAVKADGLIHGEESDLRMNAISSDLTDIAFIYSDANGSGSFHGTLTGPIKTPVLTGASTLHDHIFKRQWRIPEAAGNVRLDMRAETADLTDVRVTQGQSQILINGSADLDGSPVDLRIQTSRALGEDLAQFVDRKIGGTFSGSIHVTSLQPVRVEGDVRIGDFLIDDRLIGDTRGHVRYFEPVIDLSQLVIRKNEATLNGNVVYDRVTEAVKFSANVSSVDLNSFRDVGPLPQSLRGIIRQAEIRGEGSRRRPNVRGEGVIQNLAVFGEEFPQARVALASSDSTLDVTLDAARNLRLTAKIDTASAGYPFTANTTFTQYSLERLAGMSEGTLVATGNARLSGLLMDRSRLRGEGRIESAEARIQQRTLRATKPFTFDFNPDRLRLSGVTLTGEGTQVDLVGTVGFTTGALLDLDVSGRLDLGLLAAAYPEWSSSGSANVEMKVRGTAQNPDLRGLARLANATFGRRGFLTSLSALSGEFFFDQNRITLNNLAGRMGGGTIRAQGTALLQQQQIEAMNIRIETNDVRLRIPEGLRTVVDGSLVLQGSWQSPLLEGSLQLQSLSYQSSFDEFLQLFQQLGQGNVSSPIGRLRLAIHVEGSRNITIRNQLADVEARVDLDINGSVDNLALTGHIEASGGTLLFQGTRYEVTRGNIDFIDPLRIEPVVDVQAETELRDYRVILAVSGRGNRLRLDMRSDPPLPQLEIVSLIAGGKTREELAARPGGGAVPTSEELFRGGAASILFDLLQSRVGSRLGLLGLDRVRIDPFLVGAENNPVARVTISEQVTKDLSITYSQDLSSNRQQIILIEYFLSRNTSILASRDETGALGLDIKFRKRF